MSTLLSLWQCISVAQVIIKGSLGNIPLKQALLIIFTAQSFPGSSSRYLFYVQQWLTGQWHKQHGLHGPSTPHQSPSVSWPASPAKRDRMHLTHLSASSQVVIRACQPQAATAFKKQMLQVHSSQFCCLFLPTCQSLPNLGHLFCLLQLLPQIFLLFIFQILKHTWFFWAPMHVHITFVSFLVL